MTIHLKRFGWLYLTLAVMAAVPVMIIRAQRVPPLDFKTIRAWAAWVDGEMARRYGPPAKVSVQAFLDQHQELRGWPDPLYRLVVFEVEPDAAGAPILAPMLATMHRMYDPGLAAWEAYCHGPLVYTPLTRELDVLNSPALDGKNHWDRYGMAVADRDVGHFDGAVNMERTFGAQRLGGSLVTDADWLAALAHFDAAAHAVDITRAGSPYTQYRSAQWRQIAYSGFDSLMAARPLNLDDPPTSAGAALDGAALARLVAQRAADPRLDSLASALHQKSMIPDLIDSHLMWGRPATQGDTLELRSAELLGFALSVSEQRDRFRHASLRRWAAAFSRRLELSDNWSSMPNDTLYGNGWVWTAIPDIRVFLRRAIAREPVLFESFPLNAEERRDLDPWTMAYLNLEPFGSLSSYQKFYISTRVTMTKGRLLEAAFAARAYCRERGRWPERLDELVPAYLPAGSLEPAWWAAHRDVSNYGPNTPYLPYHIGWLATDNRLRMALWEQSLPLSPLNQYSPLFYSLDPSDGLLDCGDTGNWTTTPAVPLAIAKTYRSKRRLVGSAGVFWASDRDPKGSARPESWNWRPLDSDLARRITERWLGHEEMDERRREAGNLETRAKIEADLRRRGVKPGSVEANEALGIETKSVGNDRLATEKIAAIRLKAKLRAPARVLGIWSPGPDGVDDGGRIAYDPTNGTTSRGDIVVYPEGYGGLNHGSPVPGKV